MSVRWANLHPSEHDEQVALFQWSASMERRIPELTMLYAVPNGGKRPKGEAGKLKAEGTKAGVLDVNLDVARRGYHGLRIEMKSKTGRVSPDQRVWIARYKKHGYQAVVCYGFDDAKAAILDYLGRKR